MSDSSPNQSIRSISDDAKKLGVIRILDAEANRAAEGLRVVEDYVRFLLNDRHLTELAKQLRHDLTSALEALSTEIRLAARESDADVGAMLAVDQPATRRNTADVALASLKRVQQALRSLEEYAKLLDPGQAVALEALRFRVYALERAVGITTDSSGRLADARLYVLLDGAANDDAFVRLVQSLVAAGVHILQLRDKRLGDRDLLNRARRLREITRGTQTLFIMNDRADLAVLSQADGLHVGQEELSVKDARAILGPGPLIGVSTHNIEQARQAVLDGANYIGVGPTFPSATKSFNAFTGLDLLRAMASEVSLPAFAIGGVNSENLPQVLATGIHGIAVSGAVTKATDPALAAGGLIGALVAKPNAASGK